MLQNLMASIRILLGNIYEQNVDFLWFFLSVLVTLAVLIPLINTLRMGKIPKEKERYKLSAPDPEIRDHAAKSLQMALNLRTAEKNPESLLRFRKMLEGRYPEIYKALSFDVYGAGSILFYWPSRTDEQGAPVVICSHYDLNPTKLENDNKNPDEYIEKSIISGPDASGGICSTIATLEAIDCLLKAGYAPTKRSIYFAFGHDGETGGQNGMFNITRMLFRKKINPVFVLYGSGNVYSFANRNRFTASAAVGIAEKGRLRLKLTAFPVKSGKERTASEVLEEAVYRIESAPVKYRITETTRAYYRAMAPALTFMGRFALGNLPFTKGLFYRIFRKEPESNPMLGTSIKISDKKIAQGEAFLDIGLINGDTAQYVRDYIGDILSDLPVTIHELEAVEASNISETGSEAYKSICRAIQARFGRILIAPCISDKPNGARYFEKICGSVYRVSPVLLEARNYSELDEDSVRDSAVGAAVETYISIIKSAGSDIL
ncbi:MAG: hypothetical protein Q8878_04675 [Bacillota bacterium]|nr:hypothetical protein [Bacillota bacterium]